MSFSEQDLQKKLDDMEANINNDANKNATDSQESGYKSVLPDMEINPSPKVQGWIDYGKSWFASLPQVGKAAVAIGGVWLGFSILGAVLHVVSSILTMGFIGLLVYVGYRLFTNSSSN